MNFEFPEDKHYFMSLFGVADEAEFDDQFDKIFDFKTKDEKRREFDGVRSRLLPLLRVRDKNTCQLRLNGSCLGSENLVVDHIIPLATNELNKKLRKMKPVGGKKVPSQSFGSNHIDNLQLACQNCNNFKKHRIIFSGHELGKPDVLHDVLETGLDVVFCGTAVGTKSKENGAFFAGAGNKFWGTLFRAGLTDHVFVPEEYSRLLKFGVGLTDLIKSQSGPDSKISHTNDDNEILRNKILKYKPHILAFNGKKAAKLFFGSKKISYGEQNEKIGTTRIFVLPSTSGLASNYWNESYWIELGEEVIGQKV